jgi:hypothetical protein
MDREHSARPLIQTLALVAAGGLQTRGPFGGALPHGPRAFCSPYPQALAHVATGASQALGGPRCPYNKRERMAWLSISIRVTAITITRPMAAVCSYLNEFMLSINFMPMPPAPIKPKTVAERVLLSNR